ncbi:MAG: BNR repeat-containing protein, partial [Actinomycetota bacterium]|nr:BNR repeat-containing protein [Actinomycetota bacterium]
EASVTYPAFVLAPDGALLFFYRDGSAGDGNTILNRLAPGTGAWERVATLIDGRSSGESAYLQHVAVDAAGAIHLVFVWRAGEDPATNADVSYARSEDGGRTWLASDGSMLELPITHDTADVAVPTRPGSLQLVNQGGLAVDGSGRPHAVFRARSPAQGEGVLHVWRDDTAWRRELLLTDRSVDGRPALVAGAEGVGLLWAERTSRRSSTLWFTELVGGRATDEVLLARLPVDGWEPTFDSVALARRGKLHVLLPVERDGDGAAGGTGAVVTWDLASLASVLGGVTRRRRKVRCGPRRGALNPRSQLVAAGQARGHQGLPGLLGEGGPPPLSHRGSPSAEDGSSLLPSSNLEFTRLVPNDLIGPSSRSISRKR